MKNYRLSFLIVLLLSTLMYSCNNYIVAEKCHYIQFFNTKLEGTDYPYENLEYKLKYGAISTFDNECFYLSGSALDFVVKPGSLLDLNEFDVLIIDDNNGTKRLTKKRILTESRDNYERRKGITPSVPFMVQGSLGCGPGILYAEDKEDSLNEKKVKGKRLFTLKIDKDNEYLPLPLAIHDHDTDCDPSQAKELVLETFYYKLSLKDKSDLEKHIDTLNNFVVSLDKKAKDSKKDTIIMGRKITTYNQFCLVPYKKLANGNVNISDIDTICFMN